jgi:AraC-like DNA-binding protein
VNDLVLASWSHRADEAEWAHIIPDGCCDLIVRHRPRRAPRIVVSHLDAHARMVHVETGEIIHGLRFRPGVRLVEARLPTANAAALVDLDLERLDIVALPTERLNEALHLIGRIGLPLSSVPGELGVSARTLQRLVQEETGQTPVFWRRLARIRIAAKSVRDGEAAAATAARLGFSDQAHLSRECRTWLGITPSTLRAGVVQARLLDEPGYC